MFFHGCLQGNKCTWLRGSCQSCQTLLRKCPCDPHAKNKGVCPCRSEASTSTERLGSLAFRNLSVPIMELAHQPSQAWLPTSALALKRTLQRSAFLRLASAESLLSCRPVQQHPCWNLETTSKSTIGCWISFLVWPINCGKHPSKTAMCKGVTWAHQGHPTTQSALLHRLGPRPRRGIQWSYFH